MRKLKIIKGKREIVEVPKFYKGEKSFTKFDKREELHFENGFLKIAYPVLNEFQKMDTNLENGTIEGDTFTYAVIDIPQPTAQELYNALKEESKQVFKEFTNDLAEATLPRLIVGEVPSELQQLSAILQATKTRINNALDYYLSENDIENLKKFSFQTDEAEQLRNAINNFK